MLIAEYTTNEGPHVDDYFLVFVTVEENKLFSLLAPFTWTAEMRLYLFCKSVCGLCVLCRELVLAEG